MGTDSGDNKIVIGNARAGNALLEPEVDPTDAHNDSHHAPHNANTPHNEHDGIEIENAPKDKTIFSSMPFDRVFNKFIGKGEYGWVYRIWLDYSANNNKAPNHDMPTLKTKLKGIENEIDQNNIVTGEINKEDLKKKRRQLRKELMFERLMSPDATLPDTNIMLIPCDWSNKYNGTGNNALKVTLPYHEGQTLYNIIKTNPSLVDKYKIMSAISKALSTLHELDIVHRDLHPGNLLINKIIVNGEEKYEAKIIDLGLTKRKTNSKNSLPYGSRELPNTLMDVARYTKPDDIAMLSLNFLYLLTRDYNSGYANRSNIRGTPAASVAFKLFDFDDVKDVVKTEPDNKIIQTFFEQMGGLNDVKRHSASQCHLFFDMLANGKTAEESYRAALCKRLDDDISILHKIGIINKESYTNIIGKYNELRAKVAKANIDQLLQLINDIPNQDMHAVLKKRLKLENHRLQDIWSLQSKSQLYAKDEKDAQINRLANEYRRLLNNLEHKAEKIKENLDGDNVGFDKDNLYLISLDEAWSLIQRTRRFTNIIASSDDYRTEDHRVEILKDNVYIGIIADLRGKLEEFNQNSKYKAINESLGDEFEILMRILLDSPDVSNAHMQKDILKFTLAINIHNLQRILDNLEQKRCNASFITRGGYNDKIKLLKGFIQQLTAKRIELNDLHQVDFVRLIDEIENINLEVHKHELVSADIADFYNDLYELLHEKAIGYVGKIDKEARPGMTHTHVRVVKELGQGANGIVHLVELGKKDDNGKFVPCDNGIKYVRKTAAFGKGYVPKSLRMYQREAERAWCLVESENRKYINEYNSVAQLEENGYCRVQLYLPYYEGMPLDKFMLERQPSPSDRIIIIKNLLKEFDRLAAIGLKQRDIRLDNIVIDDNLNVKVIDHGFSTFKYNQCKKFFKGNVDVMAPEAVQSIHSVKSEIYGLGVIIAQILTNGNLDSKYGQARNGHIESARDVLASKYPDVDDKNKIFNQNYRLLEGEEYLSSIMPALLARFDFKDKDRPYGLKIDQYHAISHIINEMMHPSMARRPKIQYVLHFLEQISQNISAKDAYKQYALHRLDQEKELVESKYSNSREINIQHIVDVYDKAIDKFNNLESNADDFWQQAEDIFALIEYDKHSSELMKLLSNTPILRGNTGTLGTDKSGLSCLMREKEKLAERYRCMNEGNKNHKHNNGDANAIANAVRAPRRHRVNEAELSAVPIDDIEMLQNQATDHELKLNLAGLYKALVELKNELVAMEVDLSQRLQKHKANTDLNNILIEVGSLKRGCDRLMQDYKKHYSIKPKAFMKHFIDTTTDLVIKTQCQKLNLEAYDKSRQLSTISPVIGDRRTITSKMDAIKARIIQLQELKVSDGAAKTLSDAVKYGNEVVEICSKNCNSFTAFMIRVLKLAYRAGQLIGVTSSNYERPTKSGALLTGMHVKLQLMEEQVETISNSPIAARTA